MIIKVFHRERADGVNLYKTYSDENRYIKKVGTNEVYSEAIDVEDKDYIYEETEEYIEQLNEEYYGRD